MQKLSITKIEWKTWFPAPGEFKCHICHIRDATHFLEYRHTIIHGKLPGCWDCIQQDEETLRQLLKLPEEKSCLNLQGEN